MKHTDRLLAIFGWFLIIIVIFDGDSLLVSLTRDAEVAHKLCRQDVTCVMTYSDYKDLESSKRILEKYND